MEGSGSPENLSHTQHKEAPRQGESLGRKTVEVNGKEWSYLEWGNPKGIPILMLHGWQASPIGDIPLLRAFTGDNPKSYGFRMLSEKKPESAKALARNVEALKGKYRVIDPWQPGTQFTKPLDNISYDAMADEVVAFQEAVGMESAIVFGFSAGGTIGTKLAARHPEAVKALVIQGTPTKKGDLDEETRKILEKFTFGPVPYILYALGIVQKKFKEHAKASEEFSWSDKESQEAILEAFRTGDRKTAIKLSREMIKKSIETDIERVQCPVIVVDGINGQLVPFVKEKDVAKKFPTQVLTYAGEVIRTKEVNGIILAVTEAFGKQGHNVVNTAPEILAALTDKMVSKLEELSRPNETKHKVDAG